MNVGAVAAVLLGAVLTALLWKKALTSECAETESEP